MRAILPAGGKCFAFPMLPSRLFAAPAGANLVAAARCDRVIRTGETVKKDAERAGCLVVTQAL
jgi:hypothetical protein